MSVPTAVARAIAAQRSQISGAEFAAVDAQRISAAERKRVATEMSHPRGRAIVAWCDAHPQSVTSEARDHVERLRRALDAGDYVAPLLVWVYAWIPETTLVEPTWSTAIGKVA